MWRTSLYTLLAVLTGCNNNAPSSQTAPRQRLETAVQTLINSLPKAVGCLDQLPGGKNGPVLFRRWELHIETLSHQIQVEREGDLEPRLKLIAKGFCRHFAAPPESRPDLFFLDRDSALHSELVIDFDWIWGDKIDWGPESLRDLSPLDYNVDLLDDQIIAIAEYRWDPLMDNWVPISGQGELLWPFAALKLSPEVEEFYAPIPSKQQSWRNEWQQWFGRKKPNLSSN